MTACADGNPPTVYVTAVDGFAPAPWGGGTTGRMSADDEVRSIALRFEGPGEAWMLVETMPLTWPLYPRDASQRSEKVFALEGLRSAVIGEATRLGELGTADAASMVALVKERVRSCRASAESREELVDVDGASVACVFVDSAPYFALSAALPHARVLVAGCRAPPRICLRTETTRRM